MVMLRLRSLLFNISFFGWTIICLLWMWVLLPFSRAAMQRAVRLWGQGIMVLLRALVGVTYEIRGREHLVDGPAVIACKHQSVWDTGIFHILLDDPVYVLKQELMAIPLWGWYANRAGMISVDRTAGTSALKAMVKQASAALAEGRTIVIFPEGTRTAPGVRRPYHPGVAALDGVGNYPIIPAALNSGLFWGRRKFLKRPGRIVLQFLPPMPKGMRRKDFMAELENRIEAATALLIEESRREKDRSV